MLVFNSAFLEVSFLTEFPLFYLYLLLYFISLFLGFSLPRWLLNFHLPSASLINFFSLNSIICFRGPLFLLNSFVFPIFSYLVSCYNRLSFLFVKVSPYCSLICVFFVQLWKVFTCQLLFASCRSKLLDFISVQLELPFFSGVLFVVYSQVN